MNVGDNYHGLKLLAYCGGGAYGEVFYCEDLSHKKMAVKILSKQKIGLHWRRELKGITNYRRLTIDAPNLLKIYQVEEDEDNFFYTMEAADSLSQAEYKADTLASRLEKGALPDKDIFSVVSGIFEGVKTIHSAGFAHRDIKPDNILFVNGIPKLADLGLLSSLSATMTALAGTFEFIPPEIRSSDNLYNCDNITRQKCDLYAFGKEIYCIITGMDPLSFPSLPKNLSTSLQVKYFLRLSWKLCSHKSATRLDNLAAVEKEISFIEQKILYGERWIDRLCYTLQQSQQNDKSIVTDFTEMLHMKQRILAFVLTILALVILVSNIPHKLFDPLFMVSQIAYLGLHILFFLLCYYLLIDIILKIGRIFRK